MSFKAMIFDLDGTLVDSYPAIHESLNHTLGALGREPVELSAVKKLVGWGVENLIRKTAGEDGLSRGLELFQRSYDETHLRGTSLLPGVAETLAGLAARGVKMAVASNKISRYSKGILGHLGVERWLVECLGPDHVAARKPDPAMIHRLLEVLGASPAETLYVGDMALDVETARNAGVPVALVPTGGSDAATLRSAGPDYVLSGFAALLGISTIPASTTMNE